MENVKNLTQKHLKDYIATHYTAPRMVIAGAGAIDHNQLVELSEKAFGNLPTESGNPSAASFDPAIFTVILFIILLVRNDFKLFYRVLM